MWSPHTIAAGVVDDADPVGIAIEGNPEVGATRAHRGDQVVQVLDDRRIGMMIGEGAVALAEQILASSPRRPNRRPATSEPAPFPQSKMTRKRRASGPDACHDVIDVAVDHRSTGPTPARSRRRRVG